MSQALVQVTLGQIHHNPHLTRYVMVAGPGLMPLATARSSQVLEPGDEPPHEAISWRDTYEALYAAGAPAVPPS
jgi:hypothetical protein